MNPVVLGLYRKQQMEAARRAAMIRMEIAGDTGYLNPQMYSAYLTGAVAGAPSSAAVQPFDPGMPGIQGSQVFQKFPVSGVLPSDYMLHGAVNGVLPPAYSIPQTQPGNINMELLNTILAAEYEKQRIMSRYVKIF